MALNGHEQDRVVDSQNEIDADFILTRVMHRQNYGAQVKMELAAALSLVSQGVPLAKRTPGKAKRQN